MVTKHTPEGHPYEVTGKMFVWAGEDAIVHIPLRMKVKALRSLNAEADDTDAMLAILDRIAPGQQELIDELDVVLELTPMFKAWQAEYMALTGASLGESVGSSNSSMSTEGLSSSTGAPDLALR
jgi:hypothetical protein